MAEKPKKKLSDGTLVDVDIAAKTAECDADGNTISTTYATKTEATTASKKTSSANSANKLFLIGATSQSADASTTYSNSNCYVGTDNCLYSNNTKVLTSHNYRPIQVDGVSTLSNTSDTALNLKAGNNITLSKNGGTVTINSTVSGDGIGAVCDQIFQGAGDISGQYHQYGSWSTKINIVNQGYKLLVFYIDISDYEFPFCACVPSSSFSNMIRCACASHDGSLTVVEIVYSDSNFTASVDKGSGILRNVNIYAYK